MQISNTPFLEAEKLTIFAAVEIQVTYLVASRSWRRGIKFRFAAAVQPRMLS